MQGTDFGLEVLPLVTILSVYEGVVSAQNVLPSVAGSQLVTAGFTTRIASNQPPESPQPTTGKSGAPDPSGAGAAGSLVPISPTPFEGSNVLRPPAK